MNLLRNGQYRAFRCLAIGLLVAALPLTALPARAAADIPLLRDIIIEYNVKLLEEKLKAGSYRGEEGILAVRPHVARTLGLVPVTDSDYDEAAALYDKADQLLKKALREMKPNPNEACSDARAKRVAGYAAQYNRCMRAAREKMLRYHNRVALEKDQRLDRGLCSQTMDRLLAEALVSASNNLRDALGRFHNVCNGIEKERPLSTKNIRFVNYVFREFTARAPKGSVDGLDLDRNRRNGAAAAWDDAWKAALGDVESEYAPLLEAVRAAQKRSGGYLLDPLLFMALIRQESNFNPEDVSYMGAAGLTQIMPATGRDLGMKNIYSPAYFKNARTFLAKERESRRRARAIIAEIRTEDMLDRARSACRLMESARANKTKWVALYKRYRGDLVGKANDDRLDPAKSIQYGYAYFSRMMALHGGDISLALAAYNAGPHRVRQYEGIPPFTETVDYRNRVLGYYDEYLKQLKLVRGAHSEAERRGDSGETCSGGG